MKKRILMTCAALSLAACGGNDNVGACKRWKTSIACGTAANAAIDAINCDAYATTSCDISAYFDCLSTAYVCTNGQYDPSKLANASTCVSKATCR
jgi:hypothetical protein